MCRLQFSSAFLASATQIPARMPLFGEYRMHPEQKMASAFTLVGGGMKLYFYQ
jgi:hypothetical protein